MTQPTKVLFAAQLDLFEKTIHPTTIATSSLDLRKLGHDAGSEKVNQNIHWLPSGGAFNGDFHPMGSENP